MFYILSVFNEIHSTAVILSQFGCIILSFVRICHKFWVFSLDLETDIIYHEIQLSKDQLCVKIAARPFLHQYLSQIHHSSDAVSLQL